MTSDPVVYNALTSLKIAANDIHKSFSQLAVEINLSQDILSTLDQHRIDAATIPGELCIRLAKALQRPLEAIEVYLGFVAHKQYVQAVAEKPITYQLKGQPVLSFQEAIEQSKFAPSEQKNFWHTILMQENL